MDSMTNDVNIVGGLIVTAEGSFVGAVGVQGQTISYIGPGHDIPASRRTIDAHGCLVMPGMVDSHVHVRAPSFAHREDFESATAAAAAGGVTTLAEMPVSDPPASDADALRTRVRHAAEHARIDFCFYGGAGADNLDAIPALADSGVVGFKTFLMPPPEGREREFYGLCAPDEISLEQVLRAAGKEGLFVAVHAEDPETIAGETRAVQASSVKGLDAFAMSRPPRTELIAVERVIRAQKRTESRVLICHVSTPEAVDRIREAKAEGSKIYAETCPQYLLLSQDVVRSHGPFARVKPPIRSEALREGLFQRFHNGWIDILSSDHAPYRLEEKERGLENIWLAPDGIPALELSLPLMLEKALSGELEYEQVVRHFSENPARLLGIYPRKGALREGSDADLVVVEPGAPRPVILDSMWTKARQSCKVYEGWTIRHHIRITLCRGRVVFENGDIRGDPGMGALVTPVQH
ncbi:MAG: amidohydrolase family protein [Deltaproteobacteria bacterium]|nr:amidohydrolase family protein [Deltaproteobacteria bacterium]